jgi:alkaline phosphatase D
VTEDLKPAVKMARRRFLTLTGAATAVAFGTNLPGIAHGESGGLIGNPFTLGVASGDPLPDAVVIWTRLAPKPYEPLGGAPYKEVGVDWQVATDDRFQQIVRSGRATARPEFAHSVHVDVRGLQPGRHYWYRFRVDRYLSQTGRTRTAPAPGQRGGQLTLGVSSCQSWPDGYYTAQRHLASEDVDAVVFLGDYIYEYGIAANGGLRNVAVPLPSQFRTEADTLDRYRLQYALYKSDPDLQAAHLNAPWITTWDDHEVQDNYAGVISKSNAPLEDFLVRRANAYRAYWEHLPLRGPAPQGPNYMLYRRFDWGRLAQLTVLDTRQYRSDQAAGDGWKADSEARRDPARVMAGHQQTSWVLDGMNRSQATWNVLANQVILSRMDLDPTAGALYNMDAWDGYGAEQKVLLDGLAANRHRNPVVLTGDVHAGYALDMKQNFADPDSQTFGVEVVPTSFSSGGNSVEVSANGQKFLDGNPHLKFVDERRGYSVLRFDEKEMRVDCKVVPYIDKPGASISTVRSFVVEAGNPGLNTVGQEVTVR